MGLATSLVSPTLFLPILVGREEGKSLVALVSTTCAGTNQIAESLIKHIPEPHIQCAPFYSALLAMEGQVMKSVFRSYSFMHKAREDEREF